MSNFIENKKQIKYKNLITDTFIFALGNLGSKIILFFLVPLYTNYMTTEDYGTADLVFTVGQLLIPFVSLTIFDAVLRFGLSQNTNKQNILKSSFLVILVGSLITIFVTPIFKLYEPLAPWRWYCCGYVILTMIGNVEMNYLKMIEKNKAYAVISIFQTLVLAGANVLLLAKFHWGIKGYLIATILGSATTVTLAAIAGHIIPVFKIGKIDKVLLKEMIKFSMPLILNNVSWWIIQSSDKIMLEAMVGTVSLGLYTIASKIPSLINVIISIFSQSWGISSVKEFESSNDKSFYSDVFASYCIIGFGATVCINAIIKPFMSIYVSGVFIESWKFVPLLLVSASFSVISSYFGSLYGALKKSVNNLCSTLCAAIINILVNYLCIHYFGVWGAIIGTAIAYIVLAFYRMIDVLRFIKFDPKWKNIVINSLIILLQAILISFEFHVWIVSIVSILFFVIFNRKIILKIIKISIKIIRR